MYFELLKTQKLTENVYAIRTVISNFYIYTDGETTLCFDTGYMPIIIKRALRKLNIRPESISHIFLTHSDYDHVGGIKVFKNSKVYISRDEEQMITFKRPRLLFFFNHRIKKDYETLKDGDIVSVGSIKVESMMTPGHTPGSMSYLVNDSIMFTGDTLRVHKGQIKPLIPLQNMSTKQEKESIAKILKMDKVKIIYTGHFGYLKIKDK